MSCCGKDASTPSLMRRVVSAGQSEYQSRIEQCAECAQLLRWNQLPTGAPVGKLDRCAQCKCFVKAKAAIHIAHCPLKKW